MNNKPVVSNAMLYDLETQFLQQRALDLERFLEQSETETGGDSGMAVSDDLQNISHLEPHRCEARVIKAYLNDPDRKEAELGEMLGKQLRKLARQQTKLMGGSHNYSDAYWENELERAATTKILDDWWRWLLQKGATDDADSALHATD